MLSDGLMEVSDGGRSPQKERDIFFPKIKQAAVGAEACTDDSEAFGKIKPRRFPSDGACKQRKQPWILRALA
jgi:hypothetical protein